MLPQIYYDKIELVFSDRGAIFVKPTMQDVADLARVSRATVSRVLRGSANVSPEKQEIVLSAVEELGYKPHKKTRIISELLVYVSSSQVEDPFSALIMEGIHLGIRTYKAKLIVEELNDNSPKSFCSHIDANDIHGIIIVGHMNFVDTDFAKIQKERIPVVLVQGAADSDVFSYVTIEERKAMMQTIQELVNLGHKQIAFIDGPKQDSSYQERLRSYKLGLLSARLSVESNLITAAEGWDRDSGYRTCKSLLKSGSPTAIITANDQLALGVYRALKELGCRIPEDISVVGFGDLDVAQHATPPLNTIAAPFISLGKWTVSLLCTLIEDKELPSTRLNLPALYKKRHSVGKANHQQRIWKHISTE